MLLVGYVAGQGTCSAEVTYHAQTEYQSNGKDNVVYVVTVKNTGTCAVDSVGVYTGSIEQQWVSFWNIQAGPALPYFSVSNFSGSALQPGQTDSSAGFIVNANRTIQPWNADPQLSLHLVRCTACGLTAEDILDITVFMTPVITSYSQTQPVSISMPRSGWWKLIGGGIVGQGDFIAQSYPSSNDTWTATIRRHVADEGPVPWQVYAVAIFDPFSQFETQIFKSDLVQGSDHTARASVAVPAPFTLTCGGGVTDGVLVENYPNTIRADATSANTWTVASDIDHDGPGNSVPGLTSSVTAYAIGLRSINGYTIGNVVSSSSAQLDANSNANRYTGTARSSMTPTSHLVGGGYRATNSQPYISFPMSRNEWNATASKLYSSTGEASLMVFALAISASGSPAGSSSSSDSSCDSITITQTLANSWNTGSQWTVTLTNSGSSVVNSLDVLAASPANIAQLWSMTDAGQGHYTLPSWVSSIAVGGSIQFGYVATTPAKVDFSLAQASCQ